MKLLSLGIFVCLTTSVCSQPTKNNRYSNSKSDIKPNMNQRNKKSQFQKKNQENVEERAETRLNQQKGRRKLAPVVEGMKKVQKIPEQKKVKSRKAGSNIKSSVKPGEEIKKVEKPLNTLKIKKNGDNIAKDTQRGVRKPSDTTINQVETAKLSRANYQADIRTVLNKKEKDSRTSISDSSYLQKGNNQTYNEHKDKIEQDKKGDDQKAMIEIKGEYQKDRKTQNELDPGQTHTEQGKLISQKEILIQPINSQSENQKQATRSLEKLEKTQKNYKQNQIQPQPQHISNQMWGQAKDADTIIQRQNQNQWREDYQQFRNTHKCTKCGSNKITKSLRGKPYMPYVQFHKTLSKELGYTTLELSGCTKSTPSVCAECKTPVGKEEQVDEKIEQRSQDRQILGPEKIEVKEPQKQLGSIFKFNFLYLLLFCGIILVTNYFYNKLRLIKFNGRLIQNSTHSQLNNAQVSQNRQIKKKRKSRIEKNSQIRASKRQPSKIN